MQNRVAPGVIFLLLGAGFVVVVGGCTTSGSPPATAPPITAPPVTVAPVTVPPVATTTMTTTVPVTTTTLDRVGEIEAIFQDLEVRRLQAIMDQDEEAFRAVFANEEYEERSMVLLDEVNVTDPDAVVFTVTEVFAGNSRCIAVAAAVDASGAIEGGGLSTSKDHVIEWVDESWGWSWKGSGWRCDGPHPFSD